MTDYDSLDDLRLDISANDLIIMTLSTQPDRLKLEAIGPIWKDNLLHLFYFSFLTTEPEEKRIELTGWLDSHQELKTR